LWTNDLLSKADERGTEYEEPNQQAQHQKTQEHHAAPPVLILLSDGQNAVLIHAIGKSWRCPRDLVPLFEVSEGRP